MLLELTRRNIKATGTIRDNRVLNCPLEQIAVMKKKERGSYDYRIAEGKVVVCKWNDNSVVSVASNAVPVLPCQNATKFSKKDKKKIHVTQPRMISVYNKHMGGVDRSDQNISLYRISIKGKKWYYPVIMQCIDMTEENAWLLHRRNGGKLDHLAFRR